MVAKVEANRREESTVFSQPPYWHESGDIILQVNDRGTEYIFRVHRFILSLHSLVWRDMFVLGALSKQKLDDLPIVPLEDPVEDVCSLLSAFYYGLEDMRESRNLDAVLGVLRLSHKYQADRLHKAAVDLLLESWPLNCEEYFGMHPEQRRRGTSSVKLIKAAQKIGCTELLPTAFYELATIPMEYWAEDKTDAALSLLSPEDLSRLFLGRSRILKRYKIFTFKLLEEYSLDEYGSTRCCNRRQILLKLRSELGAAFLDGTPDLEKSSAFRSLADLGCKGCRKCEEWIFSLLRGLEADIWQNIPVDFNLSSVPSKEYNAPRRSKAFH